MDNSDKASKRTKVIVFDFDGVIVDSNGLKRDAWFSIFPQESGITRDEIRESVERVRETRYDIIRDIFRKRGKPEGEELEALVKEYAMRFGDYINQMKPMPGVLEMLPVLQGRFPLYINSATPVEPLRETVKSLGIASYFKDILGGKNSKETHLKIIIEKETIAPEELLFVGDGEDDREAARALGCRFLGVPNEFNNWGKRAGFPILPSFSMIESYLKS